MLLHMLLIISDVPSWHSSLPEGRPGVWDEEAQQTCMRYMGLEKASATILGKLGRPKAISFMPYRCTLSLLFVVPMALNLSHVAPAQQQSTCHRACSTLQLLSQSKALGSTR